MFLVWQNVTKFLKILFLVGKTGLNIENHVFSWQNVTKFLKILFLVGKT